jgi:AAA domain-containing protein
LPAGVTSLIKRGAFSGRELLHERLGAFENLGREQVGALKKALGPAPHDVHVETANRFQGLERKVILALHPLSGQRRPTDFSAAAGRMCVAVSRHRVACIMISRDGIRETLDRLVPDDSRYLGQIGDPFFNGWQAHATLARALEERDAIIRL